MHDVPQLVHLGVVAGADGAAVLEVCRRVGHDGAAHQRQDIRQRVDAGGQVGQQRGVQPLGDAAHLRQGLAGVGQGADLPRGGGAVQDAGGQPLDVKHPAQRLFQIGAGDVFLIQRVHRVQPGVDGAGVHQRLLDPAAQQPLAHGGLGLVQHPQKGALFLAAAHRFGQFQVGAGHGGKPHILGVGVVLDGADALDAVLLGLFQVAQQHAHRVGHHAVFLKAAGFLPVGAELPGQRGMDDAVPAGRVLPQLHQRAGVLLDVVGHILQVQHGGVDQDLAGHIAAKLGDDGAAHLLAFQLGGVGLAGGDVRKADARLHFAAVLF